MFITSASILEKRSTAETVITVDVFMAAGLRVDIPT